MQYSLRFYHVIQPHPPIHFPSTFFFYPQIQDSSAALHNVWFPLNITPPWQKNKLIKNAEAQFFSLKNKHKEDCYFELLLFHFPTLIILAKHNILQYWMWLWYKITQALHQLHQKCLKLAIATCLSLKPTTPQISVNPKLVFNFFSPVLQPTSFQKKKKKRIRNKLNIFNANLRLNFYSLFNFLSCRNIHACCPPCAVLFIHSAKDFSTVLILRTKLDDSCKKQTICNYWPAAESVTRCFQTIYSSFKT